MDREKICCILGKLCISEMNEKGYITAILAYFRIPNNALNWIPEIMVQVCYLGLYYNVYSVFYQLLLQMAKMEMDWNLKKLSQPFKIWCYLNKKFQKTYYGLLVFKTFTLQFIVTK